MKGNFYDIYLILRRKKTVLIGVLLQKKQTICKNNNDHCLHLRTTLHKCGNSFEPYDRKTIWLNKAEILIWVYKLTSTSGSCR